jgi:hypothetical protein
MQLLLLEQKNIVGALFYDDEGNYLDKHLVNCGCSIQSYVEDVLAGLSMGQVLARLRIVGAMTAINLQCTSIEDAVKTLF